MKEKRSSAGLHVVMAACVPARQASFDRWRVHGLDELCLIADSTVLAAVSEHEHEAGPGTLVLIKRGERHRFCAMSRKQANLWTLHFRSDQGIYSQLPALHEPDPARRFWQLTPDQVLGFKSTFARIVAERASRRRAREEAESAWLHLLLVNVQRWAEPESVVDEGLCASPSEVLKLPEKINESLLKGADSGDFDWVEPKSVPHRFRKIFGSSHQNF